MDIKNVNPFKHISYGFLMIIGIMNTNITHKIMYAKINFINFTNIVNPLIFLKYSKVIQLSYK